MLINPIWLFYALNALLVGGALQATYQNGDPTPEIFWIVLSTAIIIGAHLYTNLKGGFRTTPPEKNDSLTTEVICVGVLLLCLLFFMTRGVPLLSATPDVSRMTFLAGGGLAAKGYDLLPAVITLALMFFLATRKKRFLIYYALACAEIVGTGSKGSMINIGLFSIFSFWVLGKKIPITLILGGLALGVAVTLALFATVAASATTGLVDTFMLRLLQINEMGLHVCFQQAPHMNSNPALLAAKMTWERLHGYNDIFPVSTGRYITTLLYNLPSFYSAIWELTVTGYCDSAIIGGVAGLVLYCVALPTTILYTLKKMSTQKSFMVRGLYGMLFFQLFKLHNGGNFIAQMLGSVLQSWVIVAGFVIFGSCITWIVQKTSEPESRPKASLLHT